MRNVVGNLLRILRNLFRKESSLAERATELNRAGQDIIEEFLASKTGLERVN